MKNVRMLAVETLLKVDSAGAWSNLTLDAQIKKYKPEQRDAAFLSALFYGVLERSVTLDACVAAHSKTALDKLSPAVLEVLRAGIYQLLYMDSVPDHAAVAESVELTRGLRKAQAAGFVNGVLRSFLRSGKKIPIPKSPITVRLSVEFSCPEPVVALWLKSYGEDFTRRILAGSLGRPPLYIRVNTLRISDDELISRLSAHGIEVKKDELEHCLAIEKAGAVHELPEYRRGFFHVQDKASQLCALSLGAKAEERVLDVCAAPGGKTFTLAQLMGNTGEIVACDLHESRVALISRRAKSMGLNSVKTLARDMTAFDPELGLFDRVLCDAPCSGLGAIRRKPEIKRKNPADFGELPDLQYKILETASQYCKNGGALVYSTCTLNPAENEDVAARFLGEHPEFAAAELPELLGGGNQKTFLDDMGTDGFFIAAMKKK